MACPSLVEVYRLRDVATPAPAIDASITRHQGMPMVIWSPLPLPSHTIGHPEPHQGLEIYDATILCGNRPSLQTSINEFAFPCWPWSMQKLFKISQSMLRIRVVLVDLSRSNKSGMLAPNPAVSFTDMGVCQHKDLHFNCLNSGGARKRDEPNRCSCKLIYQGERKMQNIGLLSNQGRSQGIQKQYFPRE